MLSAASIFAGSLLFILVRGQRGPCPIAYPSNCKCFPKPAWVLCENMQAITEFPREVFNNDTKWLTIEKSRIKNLTTEDFQSLPGLRRLEMVEGNLSYIQEGTFQKLVNLTEVSLADNNLDQFSFPSGVFANLSKLNKVRLDKNPFRVFPDRMFDNSPLRILVLLHSKLNSTGLDQIGSGRVAKNLTDLDLDYTNLVRLANGQFSGLPNLERISLLECNIQYIGDDFLSGTNVTQLDLYRSNIVKINKNALRGSIISWFDCRYCGLTTDILFGNDSFLPQATSLTRLAFGHNNITHIPKDAFRGLAKLDNLLLFYNKIATIEENPFTVLKDYKSFAIQVNPFKCDCHLAWFHTFALDKIGKQLSGRDILNKMTCASPSNVAGKKFPDLHTSEFCCSAANDSGAKCGDVTGRQSTVTPTSGVFFLQPVLLLLLVPSLLLII